MLTTTSSTDTTSSPLAPAAASSAVTLVPQVSSDRVLGDRLIGERATASPLAPADPRDDADQLETLANDPDEKELVSIFKLLADETRLRVLMNLMRERELHVSALCDRLDQSQPAVSHHLALLRCAGLIEARRDGKHNFYSVRRRHFHKVMGYLFNSITDDDAFEPTA